MFFLSYRVSRGGDNTGEQLHTRISFCLKSEANNANKTWGIYD
jgi:hypothetical protein